MCTCYEKQWINVSCIVVYFMYTLWRQQLSELLCDCFMYILWKILNKNELLWVLFDVHTMKTTIKWIVLWFVCVQPMKTVNECVLFVVCLCTGYENSKWMWIALRFVYVQPMKTTVKWLLWDLFMYNLWK